MKTYLIIFIAFLVGCSSLGQRQTRKPKSNEFRFQTQVGSKSKFASKKSLTGLELRAIPQKKLNIIEMQTPASLKKLSEGQLLAELTDRYHSQDRWAFDVRYRLFTKKFPKSTRIDDAYYMKGILELAERNYGVALVSFNKILKVHPYGKKAPSAMFAKAIVFKRMNLKKESRTVLAEIGAKYPGSPESLRAKTELKILK